MDQTLLTIKKMHLKTTVRYHFTPTSIGIIIFKNRNDKCWQGCNEIGKLEPSSLLVRTVHSYCEKQFGGSPKVKHMIAISLLSIYLKGLNSGVQLKTST